MDTLCVSLVGSSESFVYFSNGFSLRSFYSFGVHPDYRKKKNSFTFFLVFPLRLAVVIRLESSTYPLHERSLFETLRVGTFRESSCRLVC